jgi:hypothetical protein
MFRLLIILTLTLAAANAQATLSAAPTRFENKAAVTQPLTTKTGAVYSVYESTLSSGTVIREYTNKGVVFAVSWDGPFLPDLQSLLGKHFQTMLTESAKRPRAGSGELQIATPTVSIVSGGHMRAFNGRAWVVSDLPAGFVVTDIR